MTRILFWLLALPCTLTAQSSREGKYLGASIGYADYSSFWYYYRFDGNPRRENYPEHRTSRVLLTGNFDQKGFLKGGQFQFDLGGEFLIGIGGKTKAAWIASEPDISSGGLAVGLGGSFKAVYPINHIAPFVGLGPQILMLHNNGQHIGEMANQAYYGYDGGWNEFLFHLPASVGVDIHTGAFTITPELRFSTLGFSTTDWEPNEDGVEGDGGPGLFGCSIKISKKL